ncbi:hypothetical protein CN311_23385 [Mesorhizobium sanjuanii]|uniref:Uncharacterized protein n=1 Tax=Mesorhizobium sanjuanii TaxID=2037900 RepID=A0A2A6F9S8_9HYPH|nr:hypothetical protein [Mesorhizobium sanjuanii]PDQ18720.1 hypothetical protein CN311_23385 [Mesorhizobium sanjuanii]
MLHLLSHLTAKTFAEAAPLAMVRHLALNLIRAMSGKQSIKGKRKLATWDTDYLIAVLQFRVVDPCQHNRRIFAALSSSRYWRKRHRDLDAVSWMDRALFGNRTNPQKYFVGIFVGPRCYCSMPRRLKTNSNFLYLDSASGHHSMPLFFLHIFGAAHGVWPDAPDGTAKSLQLLDAQLVCDSGAERVSDIQKVRAWGMG